MSFAILSANATIVHLMHRRPVFAVTCLALALTATHPSAQAPLAVGRSAHDLAAGEARTFTIDMPAGRFVQLTMDGRGALLRLVVATASGRVLASRERRGGLRMPIVWAYVADSPVSLVVTLESLEGGSAPRRVSVHLEGPRDATTQDTARAEATNAVALAERLEREGATKIASARESYEKAHAQWRRAEDVPGEASALLEIGRVLAASGESQKAGETFLRASGTCRGGGDRSCEAAALHLLGRLYATTGRPKEGFEELHTALTIREQLGDEAGQAETLLELGSLDATRSENARAEESFARSLQLARAAGDRHTEGDVLNTRAVMRYGLGDLEQARELYESALAIRKVIGDEAGQGQTTSNLGVLHRSFGEPRRAITYYEDALTVRRQLGAAQPIANTLHNLGVAHADLGEHERALALFQEALVLWQQSAGRRGEAFTLQAMGQSYARVGQADKALQHFALCAPIWKAVGDRRGEAQTLLAAAAIYIARREYPRTLESLARAHEIAAEAGYKREAGMALVGRSTVHRLQGDQDAALEDARAAQTLLAEIGERREEGRAWAETGAALFDAGRAGEAESAYREALTRFEDVEDRGEQASVRARLGRVREAAGDRDEARQHALAALDLIESTRASLNTEGLGLTLFASKRAFYDDALALFMQRPSANRTSSDEAEAFSISERMRARGLLDLLASGEVAAAPEQAGTLVLERRRLQELINTKAARLTRLLADPRTRTAPAAANARRELDTLLLELDLARTDLRARDPALAGLAQPTPATLVDVQARVTDPHTTLIELALGRERSFVWAITANTYTVFEAPGRGELERLAREALDALTSAIEVASNESPDAQRTRLERARGRFRAAAERLTLLLLTPAAATLQGRTRLVIVADGLLQSLPFAALPTPGRPTEALGTSQEVVMLPSASVGIALAARAATRNSSVGTAIAVFADPVFSSDDTRLAAAARVQMNPDPTRLPRLRFSRVEADRIARLAPGRTTVWTDFAASRPTVLTRRLSDYDVIHVAAHAVIDGERPQLSGLVLSQVDRTGRAQDGLVRLHEIYNLSLSARVVVLSACRTALGRDVPGEGLIGFARGFLYAGADAVIGTLWPVDDRATAEFMARFYEALVTRRSSPAAALVAARRAMQRDARWALPQHWAAFVLIGHGG